MKEEFVNLISGGIAGSCVDLFLFPIDTIKTRLQSTSKTPSSWRNIYTGVSTNLIGSAPGAAVFFFVYEKSKRIISNSFNDTLSPSLIHMTSASLAEVSACTIRVPTEILKQRLQTGQYNGSLIKAVKGIYEVNGFKGYYRGFGSTIFREIPFSCIQFPLYESLKSIYYKKSNQTHASPLTCSLFGCVSGVTAAALTTPLDVIKTRVMLTNEKKIAEVINEIYKERGFFKGLAPRCMWIGIGGFVFLGVYEKCRVILNKI